MTMHFKKSNFRNINFKKKTFAIISIIISLLFTGCNIPFLSEWQDGACTSISDTAYDKSASSTSEIIDYINQCLINNQTVCELFIEDESLIDANSWLAAIDGIEQLKCEYKRVKNGFNVRITYECWDSFSIINAYKTGSTDGLNERQLTLYTKYIQILNEITSPANSDIENELAVHDYLVEHISYVDTGDSSYNAYSALINGIAVCSGYTECFKTFMDMLGIENGTVSGEAGDEQHIWNTVKLDDQWYHVDVTWDDPIGSSFEYTDHSYFNITAKDMSIDHTWNHDKYSEYENCGTKYSYVRYAGVTMISNTSQLNRLIRNAVKNKQTHIEFACTFTTDLKTAVSKTGEALSYTYKNVPRNNYSLYTVTFTY